MGSPFLSDAARESRCALLDQPRIAVGIGEGEVRPVARALRVGAGKACLDGERRAVPHVARGDATATELVVSRFDVGDDQRRHGRARRRRGYSLAERNRAARAWGRELDDADVLCWGDIIVEPPTQALVELLRSFDGGHRDDVDLEVHGDLFGACLTHVIYLSLIRGDRFAIHGSCVGLYWLRRPKGAPKA